MVKIGIFGSCQLDVYKKFLTDKVCDKYNVKLMFMILFFEYDEGFPDFYKGTLNYACFNDIDLLIIQNNNLNVNNQASSKRIINFCKSKNIKILQIPLLYFPIYPINWDGKGYNKKHLASFYKHKDIDYTLKLKHVLSNIKNEIRKSDISIELFYFIQNNFRKQLLFIHSLHPTNKLLVHLWKYIFDLLGFEFNNSQYTFNYQLIDNGWYNPFTSKMVKDLNIKITQKQLTNLNLKYKLIDDEFYINLFNQNPINVKINTKIVLFKNILQNIEDTKMYKSIFLLEIPISIKMLLSSIFHINDFSKELIQILLLDIFKSKVNKSYLLVIEDFKNTKYELGC